MRSTNRGTGQRHAAKWLPSMEASVITTGPLHNGGFMEAEIDFMYVVQGNESNPSLVNNG